jgi:hypothetical protein
MGYIQVIKVNPEDLDTCDLCNQQGLKASGQFIEHMEEKIMWKCFNCVEKEKRNVTSR